MHDLDDVVDASGEYGEGVGWADGAVLTGARVAGPGRGEGNGWDREPLDAWEVKTYRGSVSFSPRTNF